MPFRGNLVERLQAVIAAQSAVLASGLELRRVMALTVQHSRALTDADAAVIEMREGDCMVYRAASGTAESSLGLRLDIHSSLSGRCVLEGRVQLCADSENDPRVDREASRRVQARSMLCVPLVHQGTPVGALKVYSAAVSYFGDEDVALLEQMVGVISAALAVGMEQHAREAPRVVAELVSDGIISVDEAGAIAFANRSAERLFGYDEGTLLGQPIARLLSTQSLAEPGKLGANPMANWTGQLFECRAKRADGSEVDVELSVSRWSLFARDGREQTYYTGIFRDVTQRRLLGAALARQIEIHSAVARSLPRGSIVTYDRNLRCVSAGGEFLSMLGIVPEQFLGASMLSSTTGRNKDHLEQLYRGALDGVSSETELERGGLVALVRTAPLHGGHGEIIGGLALTMDVTAERKYTAMLQSLAASMPNSAIVAFDQQLDIFYAAGNKLFEVSGKTAQQLIGAPLSELVGADSARDYARVFQGNTLRTERAQLGRVFELRAQPVTQAHSEAIAGLILVYDITEQLAEAQELRRAKLLLDATLANLHEGVALLDEQRRVLLTNDVLTSMFGFSKEQLQGIELAKFRDAIADRFEDPKRFREALDARPETPEATQEFVLRRPERRVLQRTIKRVGGAGNAGYLVSWRDVTAERDLLAERGRQALTDPLTGISNRRAAEAALNTGVSRLTQGGAPLAVALFDIDHFKRVNDRLGHAAGDDVLKGVAAALERQARSSDLVARWGGEEFIAILPTTREGAVVFCERVRNAIRQLKWRDMEGVTVSAGVAAVDQACSAEELVHRADEKLYEAKLSGRDRVVA